MRRGDERVRRGEERVRRGEERARRGEERVRRGEWSERSGCALAADTSTGSSCLQLGSRVEACPSE